MTTITTKGDFENLLKEKKAILFIFFDWSGQAVISLRVFEEWEYEWKISHSNHQIGFYRLNPDDFPQCRAWIAEKARCDDGVDGDFGSVLWLCQGKRINFIRYAAKSGKEMLSRLTEQFLSHPTGLHLSRPTSKKLQNFCGISDSL